MNKKELVSQLTSLVEDYTEGLRSANNRLFNSMQDERVEKQEWEQKYHTTMAENKNLEEQNEGLQVEKQALLDVVSEWKNENHSLTALNATLSEELEGLRKEDQLLTKTVQNWQRNYTSIKHELDLAQQELANKNAENLNLNCMLQKLTENYDRIAAELQEEKELRANQYQDFLKQEKSSQNWQASYYAMQRLKDCLAKELDALMVKLEEAEETIKDRQERYGEAYKVGNNRFEEFKNLTLHCEKLKIELAAAEERQEDLKTKSHGILATLEGNLQRKQEQIEALTTWKTGTEKVLDSMEEKLRNYEVTSKADSETIEMLTKQKGELEARLEALKQINSFQEHRIEVLSRKARKLRKKEQND